MKPGWLILILFLFLRLAAISQSGTCFQTVQLKCGDTIVDYLTAGEKKNLLRLQTVLERQATEIEYLYAAGKIDSLYIIQLNYTVAALNTQVTLALQAKHYSDSAYTTLHAAHRKLQHEIRLTKLRQWVGTTLGTISAFSAGVATTFIILKTQ